MSAKNRKSEMRERVAQQRQEAAARAKRRKLFTTLGIVIGALVVVALVVVIVLVVSNQTPDGEEGGNAVPPTSSSTVSIDGTDVELAITDQGVRLGDADAPVTVELFEDFSCPHCKDYDAQTGAAFLTAAASGDAAVHFNPINIVTPYGARAGSMSMCVAEGEPDKWVVAHTQLFANYSQQTDNWRTGNFQDFAEQLGVTDRGTLDCIFEGRYMNWIKSVTDTAMESGVQGTPSLWINGEASELLPGQALLARVAELAG